VFVSYCFVSLYDCLSRLFIYINFKIQTTPHLNLESSANRKLLLVQQNSATCTLYFLSLSGNG